MRRARTKLLCLGISTALSLAGAALYLRARHWETVRLVDNRKAAEALLLAHQIEPRGLAPIALGGDPGATLKREPLDAETVKSIFVLGAAMQYDPHTYYCYPPHFDERFMLQQYPGGSFDRKTNGAGEREDHETFTRPLDAFVLVAGDSHTDGVCVNSLTYANLLEARLASRRPGEDVEVLNTGAAGYTFYNYLGVLEKYLPRAPEVFVTGCYGGNDFLEVLRPFHFFNHTVQPLQQRTDWDEVRKSKDIRVPELAQILNTVLFFARHPDEIEVALEASIQVCDEIERVCRERAIAWIFVYIPSAFDRPWPYLADRRQHAQAAFELTDKEIDIANQLADRLLAHLRARAVHVIDMREQFALDAGPWYFDEMHINLEGQRRVAEVLDGPVEAALAEHARASAEKASR